jgi:hypothetical protein
LVRQLEEVIPMNRHTTFEVSAIQRCMATANPLAWRDAMVAAVTVAGLDQWIALAFLDGTATVLRVVGPQVDLVAGEPVAYHPVAETLSVGDRWVTARD